MSSIVPDHNLQFIREKIYGLKTAIMYSMSNDLVRIPNNVVNVIEVDDDGALWFHCTAPIRHIENYERSFPARLRFFRKGINYFMEVSGPALVMSSEPVRTGNKTAPKELSLLIRMNVYTAEYVEPQTRKKTWFDTHVEKAFNWMAHTLALPANDKTILAKLHQSNR